MKGAKMKKAVQFKLNGTPVELDVDVTRKLLWVLRADLGLTGTKYGCGEALCGSCTVLVNGAAMRSCALSVEGIEGAEITTIEGLPENGELHPLQKAFAEVGGLQCGFCTPGMIMNAAGILRETPQPTREQIVRKMEGNICRCGTQVRIIEAIETAAQTTGGERR